MSTQIGVGVVYGMGIGGVVWVGIGSVGGLVPPQNNIPKGQCLKVKLFNEKPNTELQF